jgi:hypothetical protein
LFADFYAGIHQFAFLGRIVKLASKWSVGEPADCIFSVVATAWPAQGVLRLAQTNNPDRAAPVRLAAATCQKGFRQGCR